MPPVARKDGVDLVQSPDGGGVSDSQRPECKIPSIQRTNQGSSTVFADGIGVVREGDQMIQHQGPNCDPHAPVLTTYSPNVYADGLRVGRLGDHYNSENSDHVLVTGSPNVWANDG